MGCFIRPTFERPTGTFLMSSQMLTIIYKPLPRRLDAEAARGLVAEMANDAWWEIYNPVSAGNRAANV